MPSIREVYTLDDLRGWPAATDGITPPIRLAVIGDPIAHSASPAMQNAALKASGIATRYTRFHIRPDELPETLRLLQPAGFLGANLTLPHKTAALPLLDSLDAGAAELGAVNTIRIEPDGSLRGFNTDGPGFVRAVRADLGLELRGASVLILGAGGGAGRALATQCALEGCRRLLLVNRTFEKSRVLAGELRDKTGVAVEAIVWEPEHLKTVLPETDLVVNTSSLGLKAGDPSPLPAALLSSTTAKVFDTVYRKDSVTPLVASAQTAGLSAVGGLSLLLHQGALAFETWFSHPAPLEVMRRALQTRQTYGQQVSQFTT